MNLYPTAGGPFAGLQLLLFLFLGSPNGSNGSNRFSGTTEPDSGNGSSGSLFYRNREPEPIPASIFREPIRRHDAA
jgi:hypothetical protein